MALELPLLPEARPDDVEDVVWGLQTASALWNRGERKEALTWIRRAAEAAVTAGQPDRAAQLAKGASTLEILMTGAPPTTASSHPSTFPASTPASTSGSYVGPPPPPPPAKVSQPKPSPLAALGRLQEMSAGGGEGLQGRAAGAPGEIEDEETLEPELADDLLEEETNDLRGFPGLDASLRTAPDAGLSKSGEVMSAPKLPPPTRRPSIPPPALVTPPPSFSDGKPPSIRPPMFTPPPPATEPIALAGLSQTQPLPIAEIALAGLERSDGGGADPRTKIAVSKSTAPASSAAPPPVIPPQPPVPSAPVQSPPRYVEGTGDARTTGTWPEPRLEASPDPTPAVEPKSRGLDGVSHDSSKSVASAIASTVREGAAARAKGSDGAVGQVKLTRSGTHPAVQPPPSQGVDGAARNVDGAGLVGLADEHSSESLSSRGGSQPPPSAALSASAASLAAAAARVAKKRSRAPILDPWSDEIPVSDPSPRAYHAKHELPSDDDDIITSAPPLETTLRRNKPPLPPPKRQPTLTGGTVLAQVPAEETKPAVKDRKDEPIEATPAPPVAAAADGKAATSADGPVRPPPPPTRKPTLVPRGPSTSSMQAVNLPPTPGTPSDGERRSAPPPAPVVGAASTQGTKPPASPGTTPPHSHAAVPAFTTPPQSQAAAPQTPQPPTTASQAPHATPPQAQPRVPNLQSIDHRSNPASTAPSATSPPRPAPRPAPAVADHDEKASRTQPPPTMPAAVQHLAPPAPAPMFTAPALPSLADLRDEDEEPPSSPDPPTIVFRSPSAAPPPTPSSTPPASVGRIPSASPTLPLAAGPPATPAPPAASPAPATVAEPAAQKPAAKSLLVSTLTSATSAPPPPAPQPVSPSVLPPAQAGSVPPPARVASVPPPAQVGSVPPVLFGESAEPPRSVAKTAPSAIMEAQARSSLSAPPPPLDPSDVWDSPNEPITQNEAVYASSHPPAPVPFFASEDSIDSLFEEPTSSEAPLAKLPTAAQIARPEPRRPLSSIPEAHRSIAGIPIEAVEALADLPPELQRQIAGSAEIFTLPPDEELSVTGSVIAILDGNLVLCALTADAVAAQLRASQLVPGMASLANATPIRIFAIEPARVARWSRTAIEEALRSCPWVLDEIVNLGDRYSALAGVTMGPLGDLDEYSRLAALERLEAKALEPFEILTQAGSELPGLTIVGGGTVVLERAGGAVEYNAGDIVLPETVLEGGASDAPLRAGPGGAIILSATRTVTVELFSILPSLIELLRVA